MKIPLNESAYEQAQMELNFRDRQLRQLREEVLDFDDLSDGVVLSDFTLDYFFTQLLRYLENNKKELEATPNGVYAVTHDENRPMERGVIFFLRQRNARVDIQRKTASPGSPLLCGLYPQQRRHPLRLCKRQTGAGSV